MYKIDAPIRPIIRGGFFESQCLFVSLVFTAIDNFGHDGKNKKEYNGDCPKTVFNVSVLGRMKRFLGQILAV
jgi:hypothetical protein